MPRNRTPLAKLTRPRLHRAVARERLFDVLDDLRQHRVVWVAGPPGAGKTTLASTYLQAAQLPCAWYQMDSGDADPATVFYFLREAALGLIKGGSPLPLLTAEYLKDIPAFARRFFRHLFQRAPNGTVLVLDNFQEVPADLSLHAALAAAFEEIPDGRNVIVLSRSHPPAAYARAKLEQSIAVLDWEQLRLTRIETAAIVRSRLAGADDMIDLLFEQTAGWTAGVVLLLERLQRDGVLYRDGPAATSGAAFDYFASQIFDPAPAETRELLMCAALPREITAPLLEQITGNANAGPVLELFYQRHLFIDRRAANPPWYHLHALFREFLLARALTTLGPTGLHALRRKAADIFATAGHDEESIALLLAAAEWGQAEALLIAIAPALIEQGRWQTLRDLAGALPPRHISDNVSLRYWLGRSQIPVDPVAAGRILEDVYFAFEVEGNAEGQLLAAAGVLEALYLQFRDFVAMDIWFERALRLLETGVSAPNEEEELRIHAAIMMAVTYRSPDHAMIEICMRRVQQLLRKPFGANLRVMVAAMLHGYGNMAVDAEAEQLATQVARPLLDSPDVTAWTAGFYLASEGYTHYVHARYDGAFAYLGRAVAIAQEHGLISLQAISEIWLGLAQRRAGAIDAAEATLQRVEALGEGLRGYHDSMYELLTASVAFARGRMDEASSRCAASYQHSFEHGQFNGSMLVGIVAANFSIAAKRFGEATRLLGVLGSHAVGRFKENYSGAITLNLAWLEHCEQSFAARDQLLREALRRARDPRQRFRYRWYGNALADLLPVAFERGIETDTAVVLVREFDVPAPAASIEGWPWRVKISCLGRFDLLIDGQPPRFSRKVPKKTLLLLKVLIALGVPEVAESKVLDALWPDEDGDAAHRSLTITLHRLRSLLNDPEAIKHHGGTLSIDAKRCWVDAYCFEKLLSSPDGSSLEAAIAIYRGNLLPQEEAAPWLIARREKLRAKFVSVVTNCGRDAEERQDFNRAVDLYSRGLDADDLAESFYQGLMRCYARLGQYAEAVAVYGRCRHMLSVGLGQGPSLTTERLHQSLRTALTEDDVTSQANK